jgi:hypothetical protein
MYGDLGENDNIISRSLGRIASKYLLSTLFTIDSSKCSAAAKNRVCLRGTLRTSHSSERIYL